jgi:hypothetical protein
MIKVITRILKCAAFCGVASGIVTFDASTVIAHSLKHPITQGVHPVGEQKSLREDLIISSANLDSRYKTALYSIIRQDQVWRGKSSLTVCFGPAQAVQNRKALIDAIEQIAQEWTTDISMKFDFGPDRYRVCTNARSANIRVDISVPKDVDSAQFQSLVGNESDSSVIDGDSPYSMQLTFPEADAFLSQPDVLRFYVLHEFGHALGANHEHQRLDCAWDYTYVAAQFGFKDAATARDNLQQLFSYDARAYPDTGAISIAGFFATKYDQYSIMKYNMSTSSNPSGDDPKVYLDGIHDKCYRSGWVSKLTAYDRAGIQAAYATRNSAGILLTSLSQPDASIPLSAGATRRLNKFIGTVHPGNGNLAPTPVPKVIAGLRDQVDLVKKSPQALQVLDKVLSTRN